MGAASAFFPSASLSSTVPIPLGGVGGVGLGSSLDLLPQEARVSAMVRSSAHVSFLFILVCWLLLL